MKKILIVVNSTVGKKSNIGFRAYQIYKNMPENYSVKIIARASVIKSNNIVRLYPFGDFIPRLLKGIRFFGFKKFPNNRIDKRLFEYFFKKKIRTNLIDLSSFDLIHFWGLEKPLIDVIKMKNPKVIVDIAIFGDFKQYKNNEPLISLLSETRHFSVPSQFIYENISYYSTQSRKYLIPFGVDVNQLYEKKYLIHLFSCLWVR